MATKYGLHSFLTKGCFALYLFQYLWESDRTDTRLTPPTLRAFSDGSHGQTKGQEVRFLGVTSSSRISPTLDAFLMDLVAREFLVTDSQDSRTETNNKCLLLCARMCAKLIVHFPSEFTKEPPELDAIIPDHG